MYTGTLRSHSNKTHHHDITEINVLNVVLNTHIFEYVNLDNLYENVHDC